MYIINKLIITMFKLRLTKVTYVLRVCEFLWLGLEPKRVVFSLKKKQSQCFWRQKAMQ